MAKNVCNTAHVVNINKVCQHGADLAIKKWWGRGRKNDGGEIVGIPHTMLTRNNVLFQCTHTYLKCM